MRRNSGKIALFALASGSAIAAATYMRRQMRVVDESLEVERTTGARKLRAVFMANSQTVRSAFRALLPIVKDILSGMDRVNASQYVAKLREKREKPFSRKEKQELWDKVKVASVTHLMSSTYIMAVLYGALALQMNLLARYTNSNLDAPVQALPSGTLSAVTSKNFLDLARKNLLESKRVDFITQRIEEIVKIHVQDTGLAERLSHIDIECLCANILGALEADGLLEENERGSVTDELPAVDNLGSAHHWLFRYGDSLSNTPASISRDANYEWLVQESLDLCEVLDFNGVVFNSASSVLSFALADFRDEMSNEQKELPFAHILPRFEGMVQRILPAAKDDNENGVPVLVESDLEGILSSGEESARFAASVFLSGEKENARQAREYDRPSRIEQGVHANGQNAVSEGTGESTRAESLVTNISASGARDPDDLGLMFDVR